MILDGVRLRDKILDNLKKEVEDNHYDISFAIILVGNNPQSEIYVQNKLKYAKYVGLKTKFIHMKESTTKEIIDIIEKLNNDKSISGIILQSPTPENIDFESCISHISPKKDIDGFTKENVYKLYSKQKGLEPCTPKGIIRLLKEYNIPLKGADITIIGSGKLVGRPLLYMLLNEGATVSSLNTKTRDLKKYTLNSDIIICGAGKGHLLTKDMVKPESVVIDAGISIVNGEIVGDADFENLKDYCAYITPNPGGVGPMTIAMLLTNVIDAYKKGE